MGDSSGAAKGLQFYNVDPVVSEPLVRDWTLRNACVTFHDTRQTQHRPFVVVDAPLQSPIIMHGFNEYVLGYVRLLVVRRMETHEQAAIRTCRRLPLGLGIPLSNPMSVYRRALTHNSTQSLSPLKEGNCTPHETETWRVQSSKCLPIPIPVCNWYVSVNTEPFRALAAS